MNKNEKLTKLTKKIDTYLEKIQENLLNLNTFTNFDITEFNESKKPYKLSNKLAKKISKWKKGIPEINNFKNIENACQVLANNYSSLSKFTKKLNKSNYLTENESTYLANLTIDLYNSYNKLSSEIASYLANKNLKEVLNEITSKTQILNTTLSAYDQLIEKCKELTTNKDRSTDIMTRENYKKQIEDITVKIKQTEKEIKEEKTLIAKLNFKKQVFSAIANSSPTKATINETVEVEKNTAEKVETKKVAEKSQAKTENNQLKTIQPVLQTEPKNKEENVDKLVKSVDNFNKVVDNSPKNVDNSNKNAQNGLPLNQLVQDTNEEKEI